MEGRRSVWREGRRKRGKNEGRKEGKKEGRRESRGRRKEMKEGRKEGRKEGMNERKREETKEGKEGKMVVEVKRELASIDSTSDRRGVSCETPKLSFKLSYHVIRFSSLV